MSHPNMCFFGVWIIYYIDLKATETLWVPEKLLPHLTTYKHGNEGPCL